MEVTGNDSKTCGCNCGSCAGGVCKSGAMSAWCHGRGHHWLLRLLLGIFILAVVFKVGFELGEFKGEFLGSGYNRGGMMGQNASFYPGYGPGMMGL